MSRAGANSLLIVINEILRLQGRVETLFADVHNGPRLSTLQMVVLSAVFKSRVPLTVPQIGRNLGYPRQPIQRAVNDLVEDGLLTKAPNPHHKRAVLLAPTPLARRMKREVEARALETAEAFLGTVSAERCDALTAELCALRLAIEAYTQLDEEGAAAKSAGLSTTGLMALL
jgi:DNA-binding MarR family transcriptional regulator